VFFVQIRRWNEKKPNTELAAELAEMCEIHPFLSLMLTARGWDTPEQIFSFLIGQEEEVDPFSYADMEEAVARIQRAVEEKQRVLIYGDYDTDNERDECDEPYLSRCRDRGAYLRAERLHRHFSADVEESHSENEENYTDEENEHMSRLDRGDREGKDEDDQRDRQY
jgi:hypothetical protein